MSGFSEIKLPNEHAVRWRFLDNINCWEIAAYQGVAARLTSVTGELIERRSAQGPGTKEFSEALGMVVMSASTKIQSKRINGLRVAF